MGKWIDKAGEIALVLFFVAVAVSLIVIAVNTRQTASIDRDRQVLYFKALADGYGQIVSDVVVSLNDGTVKKYLVERKIRVMQESYGLAHGSIPDSVKIPTTPPVVPAKDTTKR